MIAEKFTRRIPAPAQPLTLPEGLTRRKINSSVRYVFAEGDNCLTPRGFGCIDSIVRDVATLCRQFGDATPRAYVVGDAGWAEYFEAKDLIPCPGKGGVKRKPVEKPQRMNDRRIYG